MCIHSALQQQVTHLATHTQLMNFCFAVFFLLIFFLLLMLLRRKHKKKSFAQHRIDTKFDLKREREKKIQTESRFDVSPESNV